jgi:tRNA-dihydrouridine synthase 1
MEGVEDYSSKDEKGMERRRKEEKEVKRERKMRKKRARKEGKKSKDKDGHLGPADERCDCASDDHSPTSRVGRSSEENNEIMDATTRGEKREVAEKWNGSKKRKSNTPNADYDDSREEAKKKKKKKRRMDGDDVGSSKILQTDNMEHNDGKCDGTPCHHNQSERALEEGTTHRRQHFPFEYRHILAPMVGASELAFRLLCRKYGATLSYTPMMNAGQFVREAAVVSANLERKRKGNGVAVGGKGEDECKKYDYVAYSDICEFQTIPSDRPLVAHFAANDPSDFANAARLVENHCDAIDLNLGCPQRTAYVGHFGSYLLGNDDRELILGIIRAGRDAVSIPIFVKIRLLDTIEDTIALCKQLRDAGASLIAIHARYRASWERTSSGARDGPAMLDQVNAIKRSMGHDFPIIANGNVITYDDVVSNMKNTGADGIMSAEGILDNPSLYLPRLGNPNVDGDREVPIPILSPLRKEDDDDRRGPVDGGKSNEKAVRKIRKKLRAVDAIQKKFEEVGEGGINDDQRFKLRARTELLAELKRLEDCTARTSAAGDRPDDATQRIPSRTEFVRLSELHEAASDKLVLAREYLSLVRSYPMKIRSVIFHVRRMCRDVLERYQLMEECVSCGTIDDVEAVVRKCDRYIKNPETFHFDRLKAERDKEILDAKRREEGKRRAYEGRMTRKAKREGLDDLEHYLRIGAEVPSLNTVARLKSAPREERLAAWKKDHSQHCMAYHLEDGGCKRDRACAFLHMPAKDARKFDEDDEVAG